MQAFSELRNVKPQPSASIPLPETSAPVETEQKEEVSGNDALFKKLSGRAGESQQWHVTWFDLNESLSIHKGDQFKIKLTGASGRQKVLLRFVVPSMDKNERGPFTMKVSLDKGFVAFTSPWNLKAVQISVHSGSPWREPVGEPLNLIIKSIEMKQHGRTGLLKYDRFHMPEHDAPVPALKYAGLSQSA